MTALCCASAAHRIQELESELTATRAHRARIEDQRVELIHASATRDRVDAEDRRTAAAATIEEGLS